MKIRILLAVVAAAAIAFFCYGPDTAVPAPGASDPEHHANGAPAAADTIATDTGEQDAPKIEREAGAPAAAPKTGALEITVRFGGDDPAPAAHTVVTYRRAGGERRLAPRVRTDEQGFARVAGLAPGRWIVHGNRHGRSKSVDLEAGQTEQVEIELPVGLQLHGIVVDEDGRPIAGALLEGAMPMLVGRDPEVLAVSGADGRFAIRDAYRPSLVGARAQGFLASEMQMVFKAIDDEVGLRFVLARGGGTVDGVVVDEQGAPVADALVCIGEGRVQGLGGGMIEDAPPLPALVRSDEQGRFRALAIPAGTQPAWSLARGKAPWRGSCTVAAFGTSTLRITMQRGGVLRGFVRQQDGHPVAKAEIVHGSWRQIEHVQTYSGEDGAYELRGLPTGTVEVRAEHDEHGEATESVTLLRGEPLVRDLVLSRGQVLQGRVVDQHGEPVVKAFVEAVAARTAQQPSWNHYARTDAHGHYEIPNCPANRTLVVTFTHKQTERHTVADVAPQRGPLDVQVRRLGAKVRIRGRAVGPDGAPLAGVEVRPRCPELGRLPSAVETEADGRFAFDSLPDGTWKLALRHEAHPTRTLTSAALAGDQVWDLGDVVLELGGRAVIKPQSVPGKDLSFMIADTRSTSRWSLIPADEPVTPVLRPGDYLLQAWGRRAAAQVVRFTIVGGQRTEIPLHTEVGRMQRLVFDYDRENEVTHGATLAVYRDGDKIVDRWLSTRPGEEWSYDLWLLPGTYRVTLSGKLRAETSVTVGDAEPAPLTIRLTRP